VPTTPEEIYKLAGGLYAAVGEKEEPLLRAVVSRAYYAAYHAAVAAHPSSAPKGANAHQLFFTNLHDKGDGSLSSKLKALHAKRKDADYELSHKFVKRDAGMALGECKKILRLCNCAID
jgi:uncharacterized protein (UPF0332 family)